MAAWKALAGEPDSLIASCFAFATDLHDVALKSRIQQQRRVMEFIFLYFFNIHQPTVFHPLLFNGRLPPSITIATFPLCFLRID